MNKNKTLNWKNQNIDKITVDKIIENINTDYSFGYIYGIYSVNKQNEKYCIYIGRTNSLYERMYGGDGHLTNLMKECHHSKKLMNAFLDTDYKIEIKVVDQVKYKFDCYQKDVQRLSSKENYYIDKYQERNQCLEQVPEGKIMSICKWNQLKIEYRD